MDEKNARKTARLTRRELLKGAGAVGLTTALGAGGLLSGCAPQTPQPAAKEAAKEPTKAAKEPVHLVEFVWVGGGQGVVPREVKAEYERDHPEVSIELYEGANATTYPKMVAQREADPNKPLINFGFFNSDATTKGILDDMWVQLDSNKIPRMNDIYDIYRRSDNKGICWGMSGVGIMYNTNLVKEPPKKWNDVFDPKYKGKVALWDYGWGFNGLVTIARANGDDEDHMDKTFELFSKAAKDKQFHSFYTSNQQLKDSMMRGEVAITPYFVNYAITWGPKGEGGPFAYVIPEEGAGAFQFYFQVVKGSTPQQIDTASDIINTYLSPEVLSRYCSLTANVPTSKYAKLDKDLALEPLFQQEVIAKAITPNWEAIARHNTEWKERWDREVKAYM